MDLNFGVVPKTAQQQDLYNIAYYCASSCTAHGACGSCINNLDTMGYDPNEIRLIRARAQIDWEKKAQWLCTDSAAELPFCIGILVFCAIMILGIVIGFGGWPSAGRWEDDPEWKAFADSIPYYDQAGNIIGPSENEKRAMRQQQQFTALQKLLWDVKNTLRDVNKDGKLDCVDWAIRFYELCPNSRLIYCFVVDKSTGNAHLLNKISNEYIEPQATRTGNPYTLWQHIYGYEDQTDIWKRYATKREW